MSLALHFRSHWILERAELWKTFLRSSLLQIRCQFKSERREATLGCTLAWEEN